MVSLASSTRGHIDMKYRVWCGSEGGEGKRWRMSKNPCIPKTQEEIRERRQYLDDQYEEARYRVEVALSEIGFLRSHCKHPDKQRRVLHTGDSYWYCDDCGWEG